MDNAELSGIIEKIKAGTATKEERLSVIKELNKIVEGYNLLLKELLSQAEES